MNTSASLGNDTRHQDHSQCHPFAMASGNDGAVVSAIPDEEAIHLRRSRATLWVLRHAQPCTERSCTRSAPLAPFNCEGAKRMLAHVFNCTEAACECTTTRLLLAHHQRCQDVQCTVCQPVRAIRRLERVQQARAQARMRPGTP